MKPSDIPAKIEHAFANRPESPCGTWHLIIDGAELKLILPFGTHLEHAVFFVYKQTHIDHGLTSREWNRLIGRVADAMLQKGELCKQSKQLPLPNPNNS